MDTPSRSRVDQTALLVMREWGRSRIWYGDPDLVGEVSERAGCKQGHPLNRSAGVMQAIARSPLFKRSGSVTHLGRWYNIYEPARCP